jgi:hypothetical protein
MAGIVSETSTSSILVILMTINNFCQRVRFLFEVAKQEGGLGSQPYIFNVL